MEIEGTIFYFSRDHHGNSSKDDLLFLVGEGVPNNGFKLPKYGMEKPINIMKFTSFVLCEFDRLSSEFPIIICPVAGVSNRTF